MPDFHQGFDPMGLVIDWLDACKERRLSSLIDLYDESATLDCCCEGKTLRGLPDEQCDVRRRPTDHADPMPREIPDLLDFRREPSFRPQVRKSPTAQRSSCARWRRSAHRSASPDRHDRSQDRPWQHRAGQGLRPRRPTAIRSAKGKRPRPYHQRLLLYGNIARLAPLHFNGIVSSGKIIIQAKDREARRPLDQFCISRLEV